VFFAAVHESGIGRSRQAGDAWLVFGVGDPQT
jgi:hypothetical protein